MTWALSGIDPYMSGLGTYSYNSGMYTNPAMMGMYSGGMYPGMNYGMGMMYNPGYIKQMTDTTHQIEKSQAQQAADMHDIQLNNKIHEMNAHDRAFFEGIAQDSGVQAGIRNLANEIRSGNSNGAKQAYDHVKSTILTKFSNYFYQNGSRMDVEDTVRDYIETMYQQIISKESGEVVSMMGDIRKYGESAFGQGLNNGLFGSKDYHKYYTEELIHYIYRTPGIDNKAGKDKMQQLGYAAGRGTRYLAVGTLGAGAGWLGWKGAQLMFSSLKSAPGGWAPALVGAGIAMVGNYIWQNT